MYSKLTPDFLLKLASNCTISCEFPGFRFYYTLPKTLRRYIFERGLALLVALQGESSWKGFSFPETVGE